MKKSKWKENFKENLTDGIVELVLGLVFIGVGALVLRLFSINWDTVDGDTLILIGIIALCVLGLVGCGIYGIHLLLKKKKK